MRANVRHDSPREVINSLQINDLTSLSTHDSVLLTLLNNSHFRNNRSVGRIIFSPREWLSTPSRHDP